MNDAVDRVITEREAMDSGFSGGLALSALAHVLLIGVAVAAPLLLPKLPPLRVQEGFAVPMPPGGGGTPTVQPPAPTASAAPAAAPEPEAPPPAPPPKVIKPPRPEPKKETGLPRPDAKKRPRAKPSASPTPPQTAYDPRTDARRASGPGGAGTSPATPGLEFGPPGPGVPGGTDWLGDWYLAGVQRKIWMIWAQQVKSGFSQSIAVRFTILADGAVTDVQVTQSSGATLLDLAAQRAVVSAAPFGPLPRNYGTNRYTIQAVFKPTTP